MSTLSSKNRKENRTCNSGTKHSVSEKGRALHLSSSTDKILFIRPTSDQLKNMITTI